MNFAVTSRQKALQLEETPVNPVKRLWEQKGIKFRGKGILPNIWVESCTATSTCTASVGTLVSDDRRRGKFVPRNGYFKPWPNGLVSRRKLKTWVYLRLRLARTCAHLRWLALTLVEIKFVTQVDVSFSSFGHPTQVNASWETSINLLLASEIQDLSAFKRFLCDFVYLCGNLRVRLAIQCKTNFSGKSAL